MEREGLLYQNTDTWMPCPGSYGFVSDLAPMDGQPVRLKDCWCWTESQESAPISPTMFKDFYLPYLAEVTRPFGLTYYGCCEALHDRFECIQKAIPNLRAVSVSGWSDLFTMGEMLGKKYVYSRKPTPAYISGASPNWALVEKRRPRHAVRGEELHSRALFPRHLHHQRGPSPVETVGGDDARTDAGMRGKAGSMSPSAPWTPFLAR